METITNASSQMILFPEDVLPVRGRLRPPRAGERRRGEGVATDIAQCTRA